MSARSGHSGRLDGFGSGAAAGWYTGDPRDRSTWVTSRPRPGGVIPRKEVIQPQLPLRLPCYDFAPIANPTLDGCFPRVSSPASGVADFHGVTGGVYNARERIHRSVLTCGY